MSNNIYIIGEKKFTADEIILNALKQEAENIQPLYCFYDYKNRKTLTPPGWLIISNIGGCVVVYRRASDKKMIILEGLQGDFCCTL